MELRVECEDGRGAAGEGGEPVRFGRPGAMQEVVEVLDRWFGADHRYFRVRTADGAQYVLRHDERTDAWQIAFFEEEGAGPPDGRIDSYEGP